MPPQQCPSCGRFLKRTFVEELSQGSSPCPGCEIELTPAAFDEVEPTELRSASVRPPDLRPDEVRDTDDPVAGWDAGIPVGLAAVRDQRPFPVDTFVVAGAAAAGAVLGVALGRWPARDAALGAVVGAIGAGVVRRVWQLP